MLTVYRCLCPLYTWYNVPRPGTQAHGREGETTDFKRHAEVRGSTVRSPSTVSSVPVYEGLLRRRGSLRGRVTLSRGNSTFKRLSSLREFGIFSFECVRVYSVFLRGPYLSSFFISYPVLRRETSPVFYPRKCPPSHSSFLPLLLTRSGGSSRRHGPRVLSVSHNNCCTYSVSPGSSCEVEESWGGESPSGKIFVLKDSVFPGDTGKQVFSPRRRRVRTSVGKVSEKGWVVRLLTLGVLLDFGTRLVRLILSVVLPCCGFLCDRTYVFRSSRDFRRRYSEVFWGPPPPPLENY